MVPERQEGRNKSDEAGSKPQGAEQVVVTYNQKADAEAGLAPPRLRHRIPRRPHQGHRRPVRHATDGKDVHKIAAPAAFQFAWADVPLPKQTC